MRQGSCQFFETPPSPAWTPASLARPAEPDTNPPWLGFNKINELRPVGRKGLVRRSGEKSPVENQMRIPHSVPVSDHPEKLSIPSPFQGPGAVAGQFTRERLVAGAGF